MSIVFEPLSGSISSRTALSRFWWYRGSIYERFCSFTSLSGLTGRSSEPEGLWKVACGKSWYSLYGVKAEPSLAVREASSTLLASPVDSRTPKNRLLDSPALLSYCVGLKASFGSSNSLALLSSMCTF